MIVLTFRMLRAVTVSDIGDDNDDDNDNDDDSHNDDDKDKW